jgi:MATE family multidrug resistance protein
MRVYLPRGDELGELLRLALPVAAVQVGMMLMGVVDTIMVGHVSPEDLAGVALGNIYFFACAVFGMGLLFSLDPVVSQAVGAGDQEAMARGVQRGMILALVLSGAAAVLLQYAEPVLVFARQPAEVIPLAAGYARATVPGILPFYLFLVFRQTLQAQGRVFPILVAMVVANVANVFFNWVLVFGNLGLPALGAVGSGWASSLSRTVMAAGLLVIAWSLLHPQLHPIRPQAFRWRPLARMLRIGVPIGAQMGMEYGAFGLAGVLMGVLGTISMAGHQIALNLSALTFMVPLGVSQATAVLVGRGVGASDPDRSRRAAVGGLMVGAGFMTFRGGGHPGPHAPEPPGFLARRTTGGCGPGLPYGDGSARALVGAGTGLGRGGSSPPAQDSDSAGRRASPPGGGRRRVGCRRGPWTFPAQRGLCGESGPQGSSGPNLSPLQV